jgi:hypothetical protein
MALSFAVNWLAVIVAAIVGFVVGWLWWGPLFGKKWMALSGVKPTKDMKKGMGSKMIIALLANLIMAYVLAALLFSSGTSGIMAAATLGFWVWLGFVATVMVGGVLWENKPWGLFWLNSIGWLVSIVIIAGVLAVWG